MSDTATRNRTVAYHCPSCDATVEADRSEWADWRTCPNCDTPCRLPEPEPTRTQVAEGTLYIGPESYTTPPAESRMSWLDAVVPPATPRPSEEARSRTPAEAAPVAQPLPTVEPPAAPAPDRNPKTAPTPIARPTDRPNPTPEQLAAAFARPARVASRGRGPRITTRSRRTRVFLGLSLCVSVTALIFQLTTPQAEFAAVWAVSALVSFILLMRAPRRY